MRGSTQRGTVLLFLSLMLAFALIGCTNGNTTAGPSSTVAVPSSTSEGNSAEPYKIGAILSTTGSYATMGVPEKEAIEYNVDKLNKTGGIDGHPIELIMEDDEGLTAKAQTVAKKLIDQDGVSAILGSTASVTIQAVAVVAEEKKVPLIYFSPTDSIAKGKRYIFYTAPGSGLEGKAAAAFVANSLKLKTVGVLSDTSAYGADAAASFGKAVANIPELRIVARESYDPKDVDMTPQLLRIESKKPDLIYIAGSGVAPAYVMKNLKQTKYPGKVFGPAPLANQVVLDNAGDATEGVYVSERLNYSNPTPIEKELFAFVKEKTGGLPNGSHAIAWDGILLLVNAMKTAGADREKIRDALENTKAFEGVIGTYNMTPTDHNGLNEASIKIMRLVNEQRVPWNQ